MSEREPLHPLPPAATLVPAATTPDTSPNPHTAHPAGNPVASPPSVDPPLIYIPTIDAEEELVDWDEIDDGEEFEVESLSPSPSPHGSAAEIQYPRLGARLLSLECWDYFIWIQGTGSIQSHGTGQAEICIYRSWIWRTCSV